jgi:diguanylate cyclase (GGDEF)-like protein
MPRSPARAACQAAPRARLAQTLFGVEPKLRRMLQYWAATAALYAVCGVLILLQVHIGVTPPVGGACLAAFGISGVAFFYLLVRRSVEWRIAPTTLAVLQALFAISCNMWFYTLSGPLRAATALILLVVIIFCTFALRPRQTLPLAAAAVGGMGATMWWNASIDPQHFPPQVELLTFGFLAASLLAITLLNGEMNKLRARLKFQKEEQLAAMAKIRTLATLDDLTALANRRYMNEVLEAEERRQGARGATCIALLDIDFFKQVNDHFGHAGGDAVLRAFAGAARAGLRGSDVLARWGGEEFLLMLPDTGLAEAKGVLQRIADQVGAMQVPGMELARRISFSGGLAARFEGEAFADTISRADKALYTAKAMGRNRLIVA